MKVELDINGETHTVEVEPRTSLLDCLRDKLLLTGAHAGCEHGVCGACTVLVDGAPVRSCLMFAVQADGYAITTIEGLSPGPGELSPVQDAFCETHGMQCGYCTPAMILAAHALLAEAIRADARGDRRGDLRQHLPLHRLCADRRGDRARRRAHARPEPAARSSAMSAPGKFRFVSSDRRVREDRRFVVGKGTLRRRHRAAGRQACRAGDLPASGGAHRLDRQDARRWRCPACTTCSTARSLPARPTLLAAGLDTPNVPRRPLAVDVARYAGEWVAAVVADTRALAEDAAEAVAVEYEPLPFVLDAEEAYCRRHAGARGARLERAARPHLRLGRGREGFRREPAQAQAPRQMGPQLDGADRDLRRHGELGSRGARSSTSGPRSRCRNIPTRPRWR